MAVSPFAFYRGAALPMAADLARDAESRAHRPARRRRAPLELRPVRVARARPAVRHERLRRDAAGALGVGRQAARREPRRRGREPGFDASTNADTRARGGPRLPRADARVRRHGGDRRLLLPCRRRPDHGLRRQAGAAVPRIDGQVGDAPRQPSRAAQADRGRRGRRRRIATIRRRSSTTPKSTRWWPATPVWPPTARRSRRTAACSSTGTRFVDCGASRSSASAASGSVRSWPSRSRSPSGDPLFLQVKQAEASVLERYLGPEPVRNQASAWSPASGGSRRRATSCSAGRGPAGPALLRPTAPGPEGQRRHRGDDARDLATWAGLCGWALARGHARPASRPRSPPTWRRRRRGRPCPRRLRGRLRRSDRERPRRLRRRHQTGRITATTNA